jgi:hypothetical protein
MPETPDTAEEIQRIRFEVEALKGGQEVILRHYGPEILTEKLKLFEGDVELRRTYLAVNGKRTQAQIVTLLAAEGPPISQPTVSRRMTKLEQEGLIYQLGVAPGGVLWQKNDIIERVLHLSRRLKNV